MNIIDNVQSIYDKNISLDIFNYIRNIYSTLRSIQIMEQNKKEPNLNFIQLIEETIQDKYFYIMVLDDMYRFTIVENISHYLRIKLKLSHYIKYWLKSCIAYSILKKRALEKLEQNVIYDVHLQNKLLPTFWSYIIQNSKYIPLFVSQHYEQNHDKMDRLNSYLERMEYLFQLVFKSSPSQMTAFRYYYNKNLNEFLNHISTIFQETGFWNWSDIEKTFIQNYVNTLKIQSRNEFYN